MKLETAKKKYEGEWIAFRYKDQKRELGDVVFHDKDRCVFDDKLLATKARNGLYLTFAGPYLRPGFFTAL